EIAIGDVNGDALLALGEKPIDEKREVDVLAIRAIARRVARQRRKLVLEQALGVIEKAPDERRLAVIDAAAGEEAEEALALVLGQEGGEGAGRVGLLRHQK